MSMRRRILLIIVAAACRRDDKIDLDDTGESLAAESASGTTADPTGSTGDGGVPTTTSTEGTSTSGAADPSTTGEPDDGCSLSRPCEAGFCVAPYADNERGAFACVEACVGPNEAASWCFDASACCDPEAVCTSRGYCVGPDDGTSGSGADSSGSGDTTG
jgi:hypothetical protein